MSLGANWETGNKVKKYWKSIVVVALVLAGLAWLVVDSMRERAAMTSAAAGTVTRVEFDPDDESSSLDETDIDYVFVADGRQVSASTSLPGDRVKDFPVGREIAIATTEGAADLADQHAGRRLRRRDGEPGTRFRRAGCWRVRRLRWPISPPSARGWSGSRSPGAGSRTPRLLDAFRAVPREAFVPEAVRAFAYEDGPLPIEADQTISQPYIVALMIEAAEVAPGDKVLEIGAGSGYAAAVMGRIAARGDRDRAPPGARRARRASEWSGSATTMSRIVQGDGTARPARRGAVRGDPRAPPAEAMCPRRCGASFRSAARW